MKLIIFDLDDTLFDSSSKRHILGDTFAVELFKNAKEVLSLTNFNKVLVTRGNPILQNKKIDGLGIREYFSEIHMCETDDGKRHLFKEIIERLHPTMTIAIGNRIDAEIRYGKEFGATTIHFKHGKYANLVPQDVYEKSDYVVYDMQELSTLLKTII